MSLGGSDRSSIPTHHLYTLRGHSLPELPPPRGYRRVEGNTLGAHIRIPGTGQPSVPLCRPPSPPACSLPPSPKTSPNLLHVACRRGMGIGGTGHPARRASRAMGLGIRWGTWSTWGTPEIYLAGDPAASRLDAASKAAAIALGELHQAGVTSCPLVFEVLLRRPGLQDERSGGMDGRRVRCATTCTGGAMQASRDAQRPSQTVQQIGRSAHGAAAQDFLVPNARAWCRR